jgi:hypothetical protein
MKKFFPALVLLSLLFTACAQNVSEPLTYSTTGADATVSKTTAPFDYTAEQLTSRAEECGSAHEPNYFNELVSKFSGTTKTIYNFKYTKPSQESDTFTVTLLPNKGSYTTLDQFKADFDLCAAGGGTYPTMLNSDWLLFGNSCGSGFDDGSGKPVGCREVKDVVEPTLKLNSTTLEPTEQAQLTMPVAKITAKDESAIAEKTLVAFFNSLSQNKFADAVKLFSTSTTDWESLKVYSPTEETDSAKILEQYCSATQTCLKAKVLSAKQVADYEYNLVVQFFNKDGSLYVFGPCCGATEEEMPSKREFEFTVKKVGGEKGKFEVVTAPLYRP